MYFWHADIKPIAQRVAGQYCQARPRIFLGALDEVSRPHVYTHYDPREYSVKLISLSEIGKLEHPITNGLARIQIKRQNHSTLLVLQIGYKQRLH